MDDEWGCFPILGNNPKGDIPFGKDTTRFPSIFDT